MNEPEPQQSAHPTLEAVIDEIKKTFDDMREGQPGLHIACLVSSPVEGDGNNVAASFFATGNLRQAAHVMHRMILEQEQRPAPAPPTETPEAS